MNEPPKITVSNIVAYCLNLLLGVIGFLLVSSYNRTNEALAQINKDVLSVNKEIIAVKMEIVHIQNTMITEERVKELIKLELLKRDQK